MSLFPDKQPLDWRWIIYKSVGIGTHTSRYGAIYDLTYEDMAPYLEVCVPIPTDL